MKKIIGTIDIPRECISNLVISLIVVIVLVCAAIIPGYVHRMKLDQQIRDAKYQLEEHRNLLPLYEAVRKAPRADPAVLASPGKTSLKKSDLDSALMRLRDISQKSSMKVIAVSPDLSNTFTGAQSVTVNISLQGNFENFRSVLADIGTLPYVDSVENLSVQPEPSGSTLAFKIKVLLAVS